MSTICNICKTNWCGCGGGAICKSCQREIDAINNNPNLTPEQKQEKLAKFYVSKQPTQ